MTAVPSEPGTTLRIDTDTAFERVTLDATSWVDVARNWVVNSNELFEHLHRNVAWQTTRLFQYEQSVEERRLSSGWRRGTPLPHPLLADITRAIQRRYRVEFPSFGIILYRDGTDGQGFHRDTDMRWLDDTIVAVLTLGAQRAWLLRPRENRNAHLSGDGATHDLAPASGDLLVMGGRCQADWEHSVAYLGPRSTVGPRISLQWRFASKTGEPFMGASYRAGASYRHGKAAPRGS
jgi:alkylated DNA repair dioxygenase AlkB